MKYWLFNAEVVDTLDCDAADLWFKHNMGFSANGRERYGEPLAKMKVGETVLMHQIGRGYVGVGRVKEEWNGREYRRNLVYKDCDFEEYRIKIDWHIDCRAEPFDIGYVSPSFLCSVRKPQTIARIEDVIAKLMAGQAVRPLPNEADECEAGGNDEYDPVFRQIKARRGQQAFRDKLKRRYGPICQVTGSELFEIVEAAHIRPYRGTKDNRADNGLLLRADIHTLFDLDLIAVHPRTLSIRCAPSVEAEYSNQVQEKLICRNGNRPSSALLEQRFVEFRRHD
jgi:HNH endonuclease